MITDQQYQDWLKDPNSKFVFLVEAVASIGGIDTTMYLSTKEYKTEPTDATLPNQSYDPVVTIEVLFTEQLVLDNSDSSIAAGQVSIDNTGGRYDAFYTYVFVNRAFRVYHGDRTWARADFRKVFDGVTADIAPNGRSSIFMNLRDRMQQLNTAVTTATIGGTGQYKDQIVPSTFGEADNVTPVLEDAATLTYRYHPGSCDGAKEVRDNGVPLTGSSAPTVDATTGRFKLNATPVGTITALVQGDNVGGYVNTCASIVKRIVTNYGDASKRLTLADIDATNFTNFDANHLQAMGWYNSDKTNVVDLCRVFTGSIGAQIYFNSQGLLRIVQLVLPPVDTPMVITVDDMDAFSLEPTQRITPVGGTNLNFCRNWTPQDPSSLGGIPLDHKNMYSQEWLNSNKPASQSSIDLYKLSTTVDPRDTALLVRTDSDAEAQRQTNMWSVPHMVYEFDGLPNLFTVELGQAVTVTHPRYGMQNGVTGVIISIARNWKTRRVRIGFIV